MHLLWLTENYFPNRGGMAQSCDRITHTLKSLGVLIDIVHFTNRKNVFRTDNVFNGSYTAFPFEEDESHTLNLLWNFLNLPANSNKKYSHIVAYGGSLSILAAPVFAKWLSIPLITLVRGNDFDQAVFSAKRRDTLFYALQNSYHVCVVSTDKLFKIKQLISDVNISYIPNGINTQEWKPLASDLKRAEQWKKMNTANDKKIIGLFGFLKAKKGLNFFIDSIVKAGKTDNIHLLITGENSEEISKQLTDSNISSSFLPFLDRFELLAYYPVCDAIAIPSFYDGMPNVLLEACALGIPVIASNVDGMKDVLIDNNHGFLFQPFDSEGCADAICKFLNTKDVDLKKIGNRCIELITNQYTHLHEARNYFDLFSKI